MDKLFFYSDFRFKEENVIEFDTFIDPYALCAMSYDIEFIKGIVLLKLNDLPCDIILTSPNHLFNDINDRLKITFSSKYNKLSEAEINQKNEADRINYFIDRINSI